MLYRLSIFFLLFSLFFLILLFHPRTSAHARFAIFDSRLFDVDYLVCQCINVGQHGIVRGGGGPWCNFTVLQHHKTLVSVSLVSMIILHFMRFDYDLIIIY